MESKRVRIKPFSGDSLEWNEWKGKFRAVLHTEKLTKTLTAARPSESEAALLANWKEGNENLFYQLVLYTETIAASVVWQYERDTDGQAAWKALVDRYEKSGSIGMTALHKQLATCSMSEDQEPDVFFIKFEMIANRLKELGHPFSDDMLLSMLLGKLPRSYDGLTRALEIKDGLTLEMAKKHIKNYHIQRHEEGGKDAGGTKALFTQNRPQQKKLQINVRHKNLTCHGCGEVGHIKPNCPKKMKPAGDGKSGSVDQQQRRWKSKPFIVKCHTCGKTGHKAINCQLAKVAIAKYLEDNEGATQGDQMALMTNLSPVGSSTSIHTNSWIVDSGCTSSMTNVEEALSNLELGKGQVIVAGGKVLQSTGKGTVFGSMKRADGKLIQVRLSDVLLVPDLDANLLSVKSLVKKGAKVTFGETESTIEVGSNKLPIRTTGNLYEVQIIPRVKPAGSPNVEEVRTAITAELIHERLGHFHARGIADVSKRNVGLPKVQLLDKVCDTCEVSKHTRSRFPLREDAKSKDSLLKPFEVVHADLFGPVDTESLGGAKYGLIFTDGHTRWRVFYALKSKDQVVEKFKDYCKVMNSILGGATIRRLHTDGGGEFVGKTLGDYCKRMGILQTNSGPYTPEQNGIAERSNRTVVEMARSMRIGAGLGKEFWAVACENAVHTLNRLPSTAIGGDTPYWKIFGKDARLDYFRIFGCRAYVHVYDHERKKLDPKAWRGILIGYHPYNYRCYKIYDPLRKRVYLSTHVTMDEKTYPGKENMMQEVIPSKMNPTEQPSGSEPTATEHTSDERGTQQLSESQASHHEPVIVKRREHIEGLRQPVGVNALLPSDNVNSESTWTDPWCKDPNCNNKSVHMAHLGIHYAYSVAHDIFGEPKSYVEAMKSSDRDLWKHAAEMEYQSLIENETWSLVPMPKENVNVVGSKWIFTKKIDQDGNVSRYKARLVAQGFTQEYGIDYCNTFSPVVRFTSIRTILAIAASENLLIHNMDVDTAFLNSSLSEDIYLKQPEGFEHEGPNGEKLVCKLHKALYGLKQASRNWNQTLNEWLTSKYGMRRSMADTCVYVKIDGDQKLFVTVWVDDLIIVGTNMSIIQHFKDAITARFRMKDLGELTWILGMEVHKDSRTGMIKISQATYIKKMLERFGMDQCNPVGTPIEGNLRRLENGKPNTEYMSIVGSLLYASMVCRPDITFSVQVLSRHFQSCGPEHLTAAKRVLKYLKGTMDKGIIYQGGTTDRIGNSTSLMGYSDSDWASDTDTRRSTTGYVFTFNNGVISWGSKLQPTVALSSSEAEYMALASATQEAIHLRQLLVDLNHIVIDRPTIIFEDNIGCIALSNNPVFHKRTKHIDIKYHFVREKVEDGVIEIRYLPTNQQLADILTKPLSKQRIILLSNAIMEGVIIQ